jgi:hypothetical protein
MFIQQSSIIDYRLLQTKFPCRFPILTYVVPITDNRFAQTNGSWTIIRLFTKRQSEVIRLKIAIPEVNHMLIYAMRYIYAAHAEL